MSYGTIHGQGGPKLRPVSFNLPEPMAVRMEERARTMGRRLTDYARLLLEAAYAARVGQEKGEAPADRELDQAVRNVFLLADCEPEFIAETLGMPQQRVTNILAGWRTIAGETKSGGNLLLSPAVSSAPPGSASDKIPAVSAAPPQAKGGGKRGLTDVQIGTIVRMWREGATAKEIGEAIGKSEGAVNQWMIRHRDRCPRRKG